jgi:hypothetical protein
MNMHNIPPIFRPERNEYEKARRTARIEVLSFVGVMLISGLLGALIIWSLTGYPQ